MSVEILGPFKSHLVVVDGRRVPYLAARPEQGGIVTLIIDDWIALDVQVADLDRVTAFVAHAIAVASGYACHPQAPEEPVPRPLFKRVFELGSSLPGALP